MDPTKKRPIDDDDDVKPEMNRSGNKSRRTHKDVGHHKEEEQEKEIEEFFAILKRLHVALRYLHKTDSSPATATSAVWKPTFEPQDFQDQLPHNNTNSGFDLNSEPTFNHHHPSA